MALNRPIFRAELHHTAKTTAQDIVSVAFKPVDRTCAYRVTIGLESTNAVLNLRVDNGTDVVVAAMNSGTALTAGVLYTFTFGASNTYSYNFRIGTNTTIGTFLLEEIQTGVV